MKPFFLRMKKLKDFKRLLPKKKLLTTRIEKNSLISRKLNSLLRKEWRTPSLKKKSFKKRIENTFTKFKA